MIETVFLDAGGVLVSPNWVRVSEALARHGVEAGAEVLAAADPHARRRLDQAEVISATADAGRGWLYFNLVLTAAGVPVTSASDTALAELREYHHRMNLWELVPAGVVPALRALRAAGLSIVVVSNANGTLRAMFDRVGLSEHFDCVLDSCEFGVEKPDPRFFRIAMDRSAANPDTTVHVGDLYHVDVVGARAAGLRGVLFDEAGLYADVDCLSVRSLEELVALVPSL